MKRLFAWIMAAVLVLPFFAFCRTGEENRCLSLFHAEDFARLQAISDAVSGRKSGKSEHSAADSEPSAGERYIVRFAENVPEERVYALTRKQGGTLLSASSERVFSVWLEDADAFAAELGEELLYCCPDRVLETASLTNDPLSAAGLPEYEQLKIPELWDSVRASSDIVVAVLDTGIERTHEDFSGTEILGGYDFVEKHSYVEKDSTGHGTAVTGLIAATANNGVGTAGVAYGVKILPVRIAAGSVNIYSSDLVNGLRFAADAGARIVNLSFGGYTFSAAENDAIRYAHSKGCILVASAGNGGQTDRGTEECYPAAYEGVISVGSCDAGGGRSAFSQRTDTVDILMPGENLLLLGMNDGKSVYLHDSGTSYSAALFSGLAALALSALDGNVRFGGDEMEALINGLDEWTVYNGWGAVDGLRLLRDVNLPQVTGVKNGTTYIGKVTIGFNRGTAVLDGEEFSDGETVYQNGTHRLVVTDTAGTCTVNFRVSYVPASHRIVKENGITSVVYSGGTATLDGFPYQSGTSITAVGRHTFVLTDPFGDKTVDCFTCDPALPEVYGVEDGMISEEPLRICVSAGGEVLLDGVPVGRNLIADTDGTHILTLKNGAQSRDITFTVQTGAEKRENDLSHCGILLDETHGWYAVYGELLAGMRLYSLTDGAYLGFLDTGCVQGYARDGEALIVFGEWQLNLLDPDSLAGDSPVMTSFPIRCDDFAFFGGRIVCLSDNELYEVNRQTGETTFLCHADGRELYADGETLWLYDSWRNMLTGFDTEFAEKTNFVLPFSGAGQKKLFADGILFCGGTAWKIAENRVLFTYSGDALTAKPDTLYTEKGIYDLLTGFLLGEYGSAVSGIAFGTERTWLCGDDGGIRSYESGKAFYAKPLHPLPPAAERTDPFSEYTRLYGEPTAICADGSSYLLAFEKDRSLLLWNENGYSVTELPFSASGVALSGESLCAWSGNLVWKDGTLFSADGKVRNCFFCGDELYVLTDLLLVLREGVLSPTGIEASDGCGKGGLLAYRRGGRLTIVKNGKETRIGGSAGKMLTDGTYIVCGKMVYRADGTLVGTLPTAAYAVSGGCALTGAGLWRLSSMEQIGEGKFGENLLAALGDECGLLLCENGALIRSDYDRTTGTVARPWDAPMLIGCDKNGLYNEKTVIRYDRGIGFLDGILCSYGTEVTEPGEHLFALLLPCGIRMENRFSVIPALQSISFVNSNYHLAVGETASLHIRYSPKETSAVPLTFSVEGECIELQGDRFVAVREGTAVIRAQTPDGRFFAVCNVVVDGDLLRFDENAGYRVDREGKTISGVPCGTTEADLRFRLLTEGEVLVSDKKLRTGSTVALIGGDGQTLDLLTVAVTGDLDGDGLLTVEDLRLLQNALRSGEMPTELYALAADLNGSGAVNDRDARELLERVLFVRGESAGLPEVNASCGAELFVQTSVCEGDTFDITVFLSGCGGAEAVSGRVFYDPEGFAFAGCTSYGAELQSAAKKNWVSFVLLGGIGKGDSMIPVLTMKFRAGSGVAGLLPVFSLRDVTVSGETLFGVPETNLDLQVGRRVYGETTLTLTGATEPFAADVHGYTVYLPYGAKGLLYELCYPEGCTVETENTVFVDSDELNAVFRFRYADGETAVYTVRGFRSVEPPQSSDCALKELAIDGLPFAFDPEQTEYHLEVPYEVPSVELHWAASDENAKVFCGETDLRAGKENLITVTVIAEDGARRVYRLYVRRGEPPQNSSEEESGENGSLVWLCVLPLLAAGAAGGIWWSKRKGKDRKENGTV